MTETTKPTGSKAFLIVSVALGVLATILAFVFLENRDKEDRTPKVQIYVARRELQAQQIINPDKDLELMSVPDTDKMRMLLGRAFTPNNPPPINERINRLIRAGTPIMQTDFGGTVDFAFKNANMRAMSIPCRGANALSGLLEPGRDHVKLFVTRPVINAQALAPTTATGTPTEVITDPNAKIGPGGREGASVYRSFQLLGGQSVRVLAVNARLFRQRMQPTERGAYEAARDAENQQTVTLELTEPQAREILEQTAGGLYQVTLILVPPTPESAPASQP